MFLDFLSQKEGFPEWRYESKFCADISTGMINWKKTLLIKPQTFMNLSGEALQKICHFYKLSSENFLVIYDDISIDFWKIRFRETGSAGWHNGVKSIIQYFWETWKRLKIGVGSNPDYDTSDWVLSKFTEEEQIDVENKVFPEIKETLKKKI